MKESIESVKAIRYNSATKNFDFKTEKDVIILSIPEDVFTLLFDNFFDAQDANITEEDTRKRAMERIEYLRKLSFTIKPSYIDPSSLPNYMRRDMAHYQRLMEGKEKEPYKEPVYVYLPAEDISLMEAEAIVNACGEFMHALGFESEEKKEPIFGSFFQNIWFKIKKGSQLTEREMEEGFKKGKKALELKYVELPTAEQTEKLSNSAAKIVELLDKQDEGVVRLGALLVLKKQINGKSKIIIQQLNFELITILDRNPQLLQNLQTIYELLTGDIQGIKSLDEREAETSNS